MNNQEILSHIDHTQLKAFATWDQIAELCDEAVAYGTASVCIPPDYVKKVVETYGDQLTVCTVIGFPLGYNTTAVKAFEAAEAVKEGATEIDMVINIGAMKDGRTDFVRDEIAAVKKAVGDNILKVIVETCYLTDDEKATVSQLVTEAGADFIKTSTGFGTGGATIPDIKIFKANIGPGVRMKAAGGVKTVDDLRDFLDLGCDRIGTSSAVGMLKGEAAKDY